jgi:hypothetical protein
MPPRRKVVLPVPPAQEPVVIPEVLAEPEPEPEPEPVVAVKEVKEVKEVKKKRVKKQIQVVAIVTPDGIEGNFQSNEPRRSLVAHLQVRSNEVQFFDQPLQYNPNPPNQPEPYDETIDNLFSGNIQASFENTGPVKDEESDTGKPVPIPDPLGNPIMSKSGPVSDDSKSLQPFYRCELMVFFKETEKTHVLPSKTEICCLWCTEEFSCQPCIIPEREEKGVFKVYGNFCCPECSLAFLLNETIDPHVRWERMALLHRFYLPYYENRIFPAPAREVLKKFGGPMTIEQFRATIRGRNVRVDIQVPPLVSILGTMDTKPIDFYDTSLRNPLQVNTVTNERTHRAEEGLRLKRNKPLKDKESTLDSCMKISIKTKA